MKSRKILILTGVLFLLLSWAVYVAKHPPAREIKSADTQIMEGRLLDDLAGLTMANSKGKIFLQRRGNEWRDRDADSMEADPAEVEKFARNTFGLFYMRKLTEGLGDYGVFGLLDKKTYAVFSYKNNSADTLYLGTTTPAGSNYLQKHGDPAVYIVHGGYGDFFTYAPGDWRMRRIWAGSAFNVQAFRLERPGKSVFECRKDTASSDWWIEKPNRWKGDAAAITDFLEGLFSTQAMNIESNGLRAGSTGLARLELRAPPEKPWVFWIEKKNDSLSCVRQEGKEKTFLMPGTFGFHMRRSWNEFRDRSLALAPFDAKAIDEVQMKTDTVSAVLVRDEKAGWIFTAPLADAKVDTAALLGMFSKVSALAADSIYDEKPAAFNSRKSDRKFFLCMMQKGIAVFQADFLQYNPEIILAQSNNAWYKLPRDALYGIWEEPAYFKQ